MKQSFTLMHRLFSLRAELYQGPLLELADRCCTSLLHPGQLRAFSSTLPRAQDYVALNNLADMPGAVKQVSNLPLKITDDALTELLKSKAARETLPLSVTLPRLLLI